MLKGLYKY